MGTEAPLAGITVLDLTNVLAGPFACHQLAHLGADVIKVEAYGHGDLARNLGASPELSAKNMGISFLAQNAGKRSIQLNLKKERGREVLFRLVAQADVLVENFRPGVMERLGVSATVLRDKNPALIYCSISGFGQSGPWATRPAYDQIVQGISGIMDVTGTAEGDPLRVGYPLADTVGGLTAAMAITSALNANPRGCVIDVSMLEAVLSTMGWVVSNYLVAGVSPQRHGNENASAAPSGAFQCADGLINIAANKEAQWRIFANHLGRADLLEDPDFGTRVDRIRNRLRLKAELETVLTKRRAAEWEEELNAAGVPSGVVMSTPDVLGHPQVRDRDFVARFDHVPGLDGPLYYAQIAPLMDGVRPSVTSPPPTLGQHTYDILSELGYSTHDVQVLWEEGVV